ncbi:MAG: fluoride efflux transporter CrcB [Chitinophagaceae bacterium]
MSNLNNSLLVILGSAIGGGCRYWISTWIQQQTTTKFPIGTFTINIIGCLAIGIFVSITDKNIETQSKLLLLLATGFCGGFTTFSAFALENINLLKNGWNTMSLLYILLSVIIGILAVKVGLSIFK